YTFAASQAKQANLYVISAVFDFTACQEKEHAEVFYNFLKDLSGENIEITGTYPVDIHDSVIKLLRAAKHNEYEEHDDVYKSFAETAREEGFSQIAATFSNIAEIEKTHGDRFSYLADLMEKNQLFISDVTCDWVCLNCGNIVSSKEAPEICPVCKHDKGYYIRLELAPYTSISCK
ncbi:MAG: rubrerythrin family protein, partial [Clostridia bacterium]|nr:rubrerythrin family protein [Clostridia bacterium]